MPASDEPVAVDDPTAPREDDLACDVCGERAMFVVHDDDGTKHGRCAQHYLFPPETEAAPEEE